MGYYSIRRQRQSAGAATASSNHNIHTEGNQVMVTAGWNSLDDRVNNINNNHAVNSISRRGSLRKAARSPLSTAISSTSTAMMMMTFLLVWLGCSITTTAVVDAASLLNGRFETVTDVTDYLNLALDAADMKETDDLTTKLNIYQNGSPRDGGTSPNAVTLQSLSLTAEEEMRENPYYYIFKHTFLVLGNAKEHESTGRFDGAPVEVYADTIVNDLFDLDIVNIETEASLVMNVWMAVVNQLFQVLAECRAQDKDSGLAALDKAAALWIGAEQVEGSNERGHLLYNLAENAGERFDQDNGETWANTQVVGGLLRLQNALLGDQCTSAEAYQQLREHVKELVGYMTVPLVQNLIHHTMNVANEGKSDMVELYALGLIPRVAACDPRAYDEELTLDVLRDLPVEQQQEALSAIQRGYSCLQVTCSDIGSYMGGALPECTDDDSITLGGYEAKSSSARDYAYMDRDVLQIDIFLKFQAYGVALDWYTHGWNSATRTIRDFAKNSVIPVLPSGTEGTSYYTLFSEYYDDAEFAHNWITSILELIPPFNSATKEQVRNAAVGFMKYVVMFVASADALRYAASTCQSEGNEGANEYVDAGAMLYVGSMEGAAKNGNAFGGESLFSTAKELCADFNTCIGSTDTGATTAAVNEVVMMAMNDVVDSISSQNCPEAIALVEDTIVPAILIPLIQGTLKYASFNEYLLAGTDDASLSIGDAFSRAVVPLVHQSSPSNAETIKNQMQFQLTSDPVAGGFPSVADAFRQSITALKVQCEEVGVLVDEPIKSDLCGDGVTGGQPTSPGGGDKTPTISPGTQPTDPTAPENLAFGRYSFSDSSVAVGDGSFALDIRDMFLASTPTEASSVYKNGKNAITQSLSGASGLVSLSSLSTDASQFMNKEPLFNIFKYALYDDDDLNGTTGETFVYADEVVIEALTNGNDNKLAAEASVILNVWMLIAHKLYSAVDMCAEKSTPVALIDSAVALWIGKEQGEGQFDQGWMLYSIGQSSFKFFGHPEGEAPVNSKLMNLFVETQTVAKECSTSPNAAIVLRSMVSEVLRTLTKPLITSLLFHMIKNSKNMVELYAVAVVPQSAACSSRVRSSMEDALYSGFNQQGSITEDLLDSIATFLQCQRIGCDDIATGADAEASLVALSEGLCSRLKQESGSEKPMGGYVPKTRVTELARLDLDALEIYIMMRTGAYESATDIYENGRNAVAATQFLGGSEETDLLALKTLATSPARYSVVGFDEFTSYFGSESYADDIVTQAISRTGQYATVEQSQQAEIVKRTLQTMVSHMAAVTKMQSALGQCQSGSKDNARNEWDRAVALFVGSIQGGIANGHQNGQGVWMYALGNEFCGTFNVCETSGEAKVNKKLMFHFTNVRDSLVGGECEHIERAMNNEILPRMAIPLVQGLVSKLIDYSDGGTPEALAAVHIFSQALTPLMKVIDSVGASTLSQAFSSFQSALTVEVSTVVDVLNGAVGGMGIPCNELGSPNDYSLCSDTSGIAGDDLNQDAPTHLAGGLYVTTTYVNDRANIALDIKDMREAIQEGNVQLANLVYRNGKNSQQFDENGKFVKLRSLKEFSTTSTNDMIDDPEFNIFMYAFQGNRLYADDMVEHALQNTSGSSSVAVEAALVLNLWMEIVHTLHETLMTCKQRQLRNDDGVHSMDVAVAYWIGDGQIAGDSTNGHLLYALAEEFGEKFNIDEGGQSRTNTNILRLFNEAKNEVSLPNACSESKTTYTKLRRIVNQIIPQMAIPLIQGLILNLRSNDRERVEVFSHAYVPLIAGCSPSLFASLEEKLLMMKYNVVDVEEIVDLIRKSYPCLGLQCSDVGVHDAEITNEVPECIDPDVFSSLAGYRPSTDVREYARLDLDIREMDILMQMNAVEAADDLYSYGKHVRGQNGGNLSLGQLATTSQRSTVPSYDAFVQHYGAESWADDIVRNAMNPEKGSWTDEQRRIVVVKSSQVLVTYFGAMQNAYEAVSSCSTTQQLRSSATTESWDRAAAMIIGHLEGTKTNGSIEGYMLYDLSQQYCLEFGTCQDDDSKVDTNEELVSLLYTGRGAALESSCRALRKAADEISSLLMVPIIQGALSSSMALAKGEDPLLRAQAFVYSRALLPLVQSRGAARAIENYLGYPGPQSTKSTATEIYGALATAYPDMAVDCEKIGNPPGFDPCSGVRYGASRNVVISVSVLVGLLVLGCCLWFCVRSNQKTAKLPENNPKFVPSSGELNHSMDLLEKAFSTRSPRSPSPFPPSTETEALHTNQEEGSSFDDCDDFDDMASLKSNARDVPDII